MNLGFLLATTARLMQDKVCLIDGEYRVGFREFNARVNHVAHGLLDLGLQKGERAGLLMPNCHQYLEARCAVEKDGMVYVPLNTMLATEEQHYILNDAEVAAMVCDITFLDRLLTLQPQIPSLRLILCVGAAQSGRENREKGVYDFEAVLAAGSSEEPGVEVGPEDLCSLNYTSGTTGRPKGAMLTQGNWIAVSRNMLVDRDIQEDDILAHVGPLTHASGAYFMPYLLRGATSVIVQGGFDIPRLLMTIEQERVTAFTCVPTMLIRLLGHQDLKKHDLSSLRNIGYGAAPMPVEKIREGLQAFGPIFTQNYGLTEAYMTVCTLPKQDHKLTGAPEEVRRLGATGRPYTFVEVKVVDEDFREVSPGERGEVVVRSDHVMRGYWRLPEETAKAFHDGWLLSGDIATVDEQGYVYIVDRKKDLIISGGFNIYPREIEEALYKHPAVQEAAVIGVADPEWGESVKAFVVLQTGVQTDAEELIDFCKTKVGFKKPRYVEIVSKLPKSSTGKIDKRALKVIG